MAVGGDGHSRRLRGKDSAGGCFAIGDVRRSGCFPTLVQALEIGGEASSSAGVAVAPR